MPVYDGTEKGYLPVDIVNYNQKAPWPITGSDVWSSLLIDARLFS